MANVIINNLIWCWSILLLVVGDSIASDDLEEVLSAIEALDIDETTIAAGIEHSCAIHTRSHADVGGRVLCWGFNEGGQASPPSGDFIQISTGRLHSCGVRIDETIECWGLGAITSSPLGLFEQVSSGDFHSCGLLKDKTVQCWGPRTSSTVTAPSGTFVQVSCGKAFSCAISTEGAVVCWGDNSQGQLDSPLDVRFRQVSASTGEFACGVTEENDVRCWGDNRRHQCDVPRGTKFRLVSASRMAACGIKMDRTVECWGLRSGVTSVPTNVEFDELTLGWNHGCGIRYRDGIAQCWGDRSGGRLDVPDALRSEW